MNLGGLRKLSLVDYPGQLSCTVFTRGCNFRCPWCHNRNLVLDKSPGLPLPDFFEFLESRNDKLDAVCITGGEPLLQKETHQFLEEIKNMDYKVKLDTNGSFPDRLKKLISEELVDFVAMDVKSSPRNYSRETGKEVELEPIFQSIEVIKKFEGKKEFRTTVVPTLSFKDMESIVELLDSNQRLVLQKFKVPEEKELIDPRYPEKRGEESGLNLEKVTNKLSTKLSELEVRE